MVSLRLLGGAGLEGPSGPVAGPATQRKRLALLALLALAPDRRLSRDRAIAFLWPESASESARHQLSSAIYEIRKAAGDDAISAIGDELTLNSAVIRADVADFVASLAAGDAERAVAVYRGPFLDGFFLSDATEFERWADAERSRLADGYARALEALAQTAEEQGEGAAAVEWWKARAAHDPYDSRVALRLVRALDAVGNRAGALQHAAIHERLLLEEFGAAPAPELVAMARQLRSTSVARVHADASQTAGAGAGTESESADQDAPPRRVDHDPPRPTQRPPRFRTARVLMRWATPLALLVVGGLAVILVGGWPTQHTSSAFDGRRVVVAPFENRTGDAALDPIGSMVADRIADGLSRQNGVRVILASAERPVPGQESSVGSVGSSVAAVSSDSDTALIISGAFYRRGDSLQFHTRITDAFDRSLVRSLEPITGARAHPGLAVDEVGQRATAAAAIVLDTRLAQLGNLSSAPANSDAYNACMEGLDPFLAADWPVATRHFERALELDPTYLFPILHLGYVRLNVGDLAAADSIARVLDRSREHMMPFELAILDLLKAYVAEDPMASYEAAKRAATIGPGSPPHVQWGAEALRLNRPREAIAILSRIVPGAGPVGGWPLYWTTLTASHHQLGRHRAELKQARRARAMFPTESWPLLLEARALAALGRPGALEPLVLAREYLPDHQTPRPEEIMAVMARELRVHGRAAHSQAWFDRALHGHRTQLANGGAHSATHKDLAFILLAMSRNAEADASFQDLNREEPDDAAVLGALGVLAAQRGDTAEARGIGDRLAALKRPYNVGDQLLWRSCIAAHAGHLPGALTLLRQAAGRGARFDHTSICLDPLRDYKPFREFARTRV